MKQIVLDFSSAGIGRGVKHFMYGILLAAGVGAVSFGLAYLRHYQISTTNVEIASIIPFFSELIQGISKWLTTQQIANDASTAATSTVLGDGSEMPAA